MPDSAGNAAVGRVRTNEPPAPAGLDPYGAFVDRVAEPGEGPRLAVKDMIAVAGLLQTAGLPVRAGRRAERDAAVVAAFRAAGYAIVGTTATDNAGFGTMTDVVTNPRHETRAVGGSSGGSAAAVAGGLADVGLGTDTGGSVRIPAAYCDLVSFKPSPEGALMDGVLPLSRSFDVTGVMAHDLATLGRVAPLLVDRWDAPDEAPPRFAFASDELAIVDPQIAAAFAPVRERFAAEPMGSPVDYRTMAIAHSDIVCAEALDVHRNDWAQAPHLFPQIASDGLSYGQTLTDDRLAEARAVTASARRAWRAAMDADRILVLPTLPMAPSPRWAKSVVVGEREMPITNANIRLTETFNIAGFPVVVAPVDGLSVQFVGAAGRDAWLLATVTRLLAGAFFGRMGSSER